MLVYLMEVSYTNHPNLNRIVMDFPLQTIHFGVPPFMETTIWKLAPSDRWIMMFYDLPIKHGIFHRYVELPAGIAGLLFSKIEAFKV